MMRHLGRVLDATALGISWRNGFDPLHRLWAEHPLAAIGTLLKLKPSHDIGLAIVLFTKILADLLETFAPAVWTMVERIHNHVCPTSPV
jgi:hypothetical protein